MSAAGGRSGRLLQAAVRALAGLAVVVGLSAFAAPQAVAAPATTAAGPAVKVVADTRRSGFDDMSPANQAMQRDDAQNPAILWAQDGAALWAEPPAAGRPACAACHGAAAASLRGVAARYPRFDPSRQRPVALRERINGCRTQRQRMPPLPAEGQPLLALEAHVALASRGQPIRPDADRRLAPWRVRGEALFRQRMGQLDFSCAACHDRHAGQRLGGSIIPQGHPTGYPLYRLEWQGLGSLGRRLRNCMVGMRAEPFADGSAEWAALETYLATRAAGMAFDGPALRP